jgi:hypothetical protein
MSGIVLAFAGATTGPAPPPPIGSAYGGGFFAGQIGVGGVASHNLIVGPVASAVSASKQFKTTNTATTGTSSAIDGPTNSSNMNNASHPAAEFCEGLTIGGFSDWYLPAKNELEVCYYNLKPTTADNVTTSGINANAIPARASNYTAGTPAQTSATDFRNTGAEDFQSAYYWSSTQSAVYSGTNAYRQEFSYGYQRNSAKTNQFDVRAVRRVAV